MPGFYAVVTFLLLSMGSASRNAATRGLCTLGLILFGMGYTIGAIGWHFAVEATTPSPAVAAMVQYQRFPQVARGGRAVQASGGAPPYMGPVDLAEPSR